MTFCLVGDFAGLVEGGLAPDILLLQPIRIIMVGPS